MDKAVRDAQRKRERYTDNPEIKSHDYEKRKQRQKQRYMTDHAWRLSRIRYATDYRRRVLYGVSPEAFDGILVAQNHQCSGCLVAINRGSHLDHDHKTGKVRGILCRKCNHILGKAKDNADVLARLAEYLRRL